MSSYRGVCDHEILDVFICFLMFLITLKLIVFKNKSNFLIWMFFCLIVTEPYGVVPYLFW